MTETLGNITLKEAQADALHALKNGYILAGDVGSGKTYISIFWAAKNAGWYRHIYVITEAVKRDKVEQGHTKPDWQESFENCGIPEDRYTVDSWNNIHKYGQVSDALFIFDEQRALNYNPYNKSSWGYNFVEIGKRNKWIIASATPGDEWIEYLPIFLANGFFKNKTQFVNEHVIYDQYAKFPKIKKYIDTYKLDTLRKRILVPVEVIRHTKRKHIDVICRYDEKEYKRIEETRFNKETDMPIETAAEYAQCLRKVTATSANRVDKANEIMYGNRRIIVFYRFDYERDLLIKLAEGLGKPWSEWSGHAHQQIPEGDDWTYLCQYAAASKAWSCITTDAMLFYSPSGSYKTMEQCEGRIDRLNTPYTELNYYYLQSKAAIDKATMRSLAGGKEFNEAAWAKKAGFNNVGIKISEHGPKATY